jgi:hypothetical protein
MMIGLIGLRGSRISVGPECSSRACTSQVIQWGIRLSFIETAIPYTVLFFSQIPLLLCGPKHPWLEFNFYQENSPAAVMLDSSNTSQLWQASGKLADDLSLLGNFSFTYDSDVSITTTLVEGIMSQFPVTQDLLDSTSTTDATSKHEGSKSVTYTPQIVSDLASDGPQRSDSNTLSESVEARTMTKPAQRSESTQERLKELWARRFTHPWKMKPTYASGGR